MDDTPKPCPFCGEDDAYFTSHYVSPNVRVACGTCGASSIDKCCKEDAVKLWNARATPKAETVGRITERKCKMNFEPTHTMGKNGPRCKPLNFESDHISNECLLDNGVVVEVPTLDLIPINPPLKCEPEYVTVRRLIDGYGAMHRDWWTSRDPDSVKHHTNTGDERTFLVGVPMVEEFVEHFDVGIKGYKWGGISFSPLGDDFKFRSLIPCKETLDEARIAVWEYMIEHEPDKARAWIEQ